MIAPIAVLELATLALLCAVASQPLFYLLALGRASASLSGPAWVELRQRVDEAIALPLKVLYPSAIVSALGLTAAAALQGRGVLAAAALVAGLCLVADALLALKGNVPFNTRVNGWRPDAPPPEWAEVRSAWSRVFAVRQALTCCALAVLLVAVVFR